MNIFKNIALLFVSCMVSLLILITGVWLIWSDEFQTSGIFIPEDAYTNQEEATDDELYRLASAYQHGTGGQNEDIQKSLKLYKRSADRGHVKSLHKFARLLKQEKKEGYEVYYREAANLGSIDAQFELGYMYSVGDGVVQSDEKAFEWISRAAGSGHLQAIEMMASIYSQGLLGKKPSAEKSNYWKERIGR